METVNSEEVLDNIDGAITDAILKIVLRPDIFKIALKKIKSLFNLQTDQNAKHADESETASETARDGSEEHRE